MKSFDNQVVAKIRLAVSFLGEKEQLAWWTSSFFSKGSSAFLSPLFPRTELLAHCRGASNAAMRIHDERIGVGKVFHLFRLPEEMERGIQQILCNTSSIAEFRSAIADTNTAFEYLAGFGLTDVKPGPIRVGDAKELRFESLWKNVASRYAYGVKNRIQVFPFIVDDQ